MMLFPKMLSKRTLSARRKRSPSLNLCLLQRSQLLLLHLSTISLFMLKRSTMHQFIPGSMLLRNQFTTNQLIPMLQHTVNQFMKKLSLLRCTCARQSIPWKLLTTL